MQSSRAPIRKMAIYALGVVVAIVLIGPVGEFFIELARERGLYNSPTQRVAKMTAVISEFVASYPFGAFAGVVAGFALGVWLDAILKRNEAPPDLSVEAEALAVRAETLAAKMASLVGQMSSAGAIAWEEDNEAFRTGGPSTNQKATRVRATAVEKFGEMYLPEALKIIAEAKKIIPLDDWQIQHIMMLGGGYGLAEVPRFLTELATNLRDQRSNVPDLYAFDKVNAENDRLNAQIKALLGAKPTERVNARRFRWPF